jgi:hypothetical protein
MTLILIAITVGVTFLAFNQSETFERLTFIPYQVWHDRQWYRMLTGGLVHANPQHILFNMLSFYFFGPTVEAYFGVIFAPFGSIAFVLFYLLAIVVAGIPDLIKSKDNYNYRAVGASGAVSAGIFASILFSPDSTIIFMIFPMPAFVFAILYLAYSAYMSRRQSDNIGHLAHFSGAVFGFLFPLLFNPSLLLIFIHKITGQ